MCLTHMFVYLCMYYMYESDLVTLDQILILLRFLANNRAFFEKILGNIILLVGQVLNFFFFL